MLYTVRVQGFIYVLKFVKHDFLKIKDNEIFSLYYSILNNNNNIVHVRIRKVYRKALLRFH